ncbi:MAG TPA: hypothetical protein VGB23_06115, partial [Nitrospirota bacterium]
MKKTLLVLLLLVILPCRAHAFDLGSFLGIGGENGNAAEGQGQKKGTSKFLIHFTTGGTLETDNYSIGQDSIVVMTESGSLYFDKKMVKSIEEVVGVEEEPVQSIAIEPSATQTRPPAQKPAEKPAQPATNGRRTAPSVPAPTATEPTDDNGHTESWWKSRAKNWQEKKADAEERYKQAEGDWAKYSGTVGDLSRGVPAPLTDAQKKALTDQGFIKDNTPFIPTEDELKDLSGEELLELQRAGVDKTPTVPVGSGYDILKYQDLRSSARIEMDRARSDLDEANRMLKEVLPEEARKAGAPP